VRKDPVKNLSRFHENIRESLICVALALKDGFKPPISLISAMIWIASVVGWGIVFYFIKDPIFHALPELPQLIPAISEGLRYLVVAVLYISLVIITVRVSIELWLMKRIQKFCLTYYPDLSLKHKTSILVSLRDAPKSAGTFLFGGLICLMIPGIGPALLFLLMGYINVRSLMNDALDGLVSESERRAIIESNRLTMLLIGALLEGIVLIPIVGLFAPSILGLSVCHLCMRQTKKLQLLERRP
jgi:hypothetical protein